MNDVISGSAKVVVERRGFHHWIAQSISCGEVVSVFLYLLYFPSYDVINDVIMSDADCTAGREPRSIAASFCFLICWEVYVKVVWDCWETTLYYVAMLINLTRYYGCSGLVVTCCERTQVWIWLRVVVFIVMATVIYASDMGYTPLLHCLDRLSLPPSEWQ